MEHDFIPFTKLARLSRDIVITEKLDGTNASVLITPGYHGDEHVIHYRVKRSRCVGSVVPLDTGKQILNE